MKYYSETLKQLFDTPEALQEAELASKRAEMEKEAKAKAKKAEARSVEDAFKARNAVRSKYNEKVAALRKQYAADLLKLRTSFDEALSTEAATLDAAEKAYDTALKEFIKKHPEGYHMTLKDGDNVVTLSSENNVRKTSATTSMNMLDWLDTIFKI